MKCQERVNTISFLQSCVDQKIQRYKMIIENTRHELKKMGEGFRIMEKKLGDENIEIIESALNKASVDVKKINAIIEQYQQTTYDSSVILENHSNVGLLIKKDDMVFQNEIYKENLEIIITENCDISHLINSKIQTCKNLTIKILNEVSILFNNQVELPLNFNLRIEGDQNKKPKIIVNDFITNNNCSIFTRIVIPLSSTLEIRNVNIDVNIQSFQKGKSYIESHDDLAALFVISGSNSLSFGQGSIKLENMIIKTNLSVINVGMHGFAQIILRNIDILMNESDSKLPFIIRKYGNNNSKAFILLSCSEIQNDSNTLIIEEE
ncbi:hypothetical protein TRFO_21456 [Tritrichomonas foetus]|uniref:Uncharacterized protein n=1 Tax=Tritrichomonas foetus TaxID=1144522 RepID=A0A1J4KDS0_9EUKA|nr:hypothetical protein TRFO_21456 [Tritrichomonas foetus]|eukprot:OHT09577.1 hypothetical protein TRFO_21456 [Tritrichomonas foetus]